MRDDSRRTGPEASHAIEIPGAESLASWALSRTEIRPGNTVTFLSQVDLTQVERIRAAAANDPPTYTAFVVTAVARALKDFPYANRRVCRLPWRPFSGKRLQRFHHRDVAVEREAPVAGAVGLPDVIRDADLLTPAQISAALRAFEANLEASVPAREFRSRLTALAGRLALHQLGSPALWARYRGAAALVCGGPSRHGVGAVLATWGHPIGLSFGRPVDSPVVRGTEVVARRTFTLSLNFDRRVMAGAQAARFFKRIVDVLENAESEMATAPNSESAAGASGRDDRAPPYVIEPKDRFFEVIGAMSESEIHPGDKLTLLAEVDLGEVEALRGRASGGRKPSYTAFVARAMGLALKETPVTNRRPCLPAVFFLNGWRFQRFTRRDLAVAVERDLSGSESAVFIDILRDADRLSLDEMTDQLHALAVCDVATNTQWREFSTIVNRLPIPLAKFLVGLPRLSPGLWVKYRGGALMISSPAKYGVDVVAGSWPHALGVSFGLVKPRPVVRDGAVVARPTFVLSFNYDRRVMTPAEAARFFRRTVDLLESAEAALTTAQAPCP